MGIANQSTGFALSWLFIEPEPYYNEDSCKSNFKAN